MVAVEGVGTMRVGPVAPGHDEHQSVVCVPSPPGKRRVPSGQEPTHTELAHDLLSQSNG